jgi:hypothetical protein
VWKRVVVLGLSSMGLEVEDVVFVKGLMEYEKKRGK